ncbi:MAG TPA: glycosyltransferase family 9 protein [Capsulimonadaceae bacterium]|jgi:lipopolysaccharide heptosyltransferase II
MPEAQQGTSLQSIPARTSGAYRKALIVRFGGLGDILLSTPTVRAIAQEFPGIEIDYIVGKGLTPVLSGIPYIRRIIEFDKNGADSSPHAIASFLSRLASEGYDLFVNLHPSVKTALFGLASGARKHVWFVKDRRRNALTGKVPHAIDDFAKELSHLGIDDIDSHAMDFVVPAADVAQAREILASTGVAETDKLLVMNPAATRYVNRWAPERFADLCDRYVGIDGVKVVVTGGSGDRKLIDEMLGNSQRARDVIDLGGKLSIKQLGAVLARADAFVTADTGPMHIAAALDAPLICLSGAADPDRTGPLSPKSTVLIDRSLPCVSCQNKTCQFGMDIKCMTGISVDAVASAIDDKFRVSLRMNQSM